MSNLNDLTARIDAAQKKLAQQWELTKALWKDSVSRNFEKTHISPIESQTRKMLHELDRLAQVIAQARKNVK